MNVFTGNETPDRLFLVDVPSQVSVNCDDHRSLNVAIASLKMLLTDFDNYVLTTSDVLWNLMANGDGDNLI